MMGWYGHGMGSLGWLGMGVFWLFLLGLIVALVMRLLPSRADGTTRHTSESALESPDANYRVTIRPEQAAPSSPPVWLWR